MSGRQFAPPRRTEAWVKSDPVERTITLTFPDHGKIEMSVRDAKELFRVGLALAEGIEPDAPGEFVAECRNPTHDKETCDGWSMTCGRDGAPR